MQHALLCGAFVIGCAVIPVAARANLFSLFESGRAVQSGPRELYVTPDRDGLYYVFAEVNGARIRFVIDSGSDDVVLTGKDARRAGIDVSHLDFSEEYDAETGSGMEANTRVHQLAIGPLAMTDFPVAVNRDGGTSLLGMPFLRRMKSVEIRGGRLYLRW
ncbi:MAG: TIGR02281 family clan AA aspartic protease [Proteobacteria bacterium]|nr:TIGR02281 family clan AA aspartic protease [Pseudomonadota bacterium]